MPTCTLLADDHLVVRSGLKTLIHESPDLIVVAEAGDGDHLPAPVVTWRPGAQLRLMASEWRPATWAAFSKRGPR